MDDVIVHVNWASWVLQPRTESGRVWFRKNFSCMEVAVETNRGPNIVRAMVADGLGIWFDAGPSTRTNYGCGQRLERVEQPRKEAKDGPQTRNE